VHVGGELDGKCGGLTFTGLDQLDGAPSGADNLIRQVQTNSIVPAAFRGKERLEDSSTNSFWDGEAVVRDSDRILRYIAFDHYGNNRVRASRDSLDSIIQNVKNSAGKFSGHPFPPALCVEVGLEEHFVHDDLKMHESQQIVHHLRKADQLLLSPGLRDEKQAAQFASGPLKALIDHLQSFPGFAREIPLHGQDLHISESGSEGIVNLVSQARRQLPESFCQCSLSIPWCNWLILC